MKTHLIICICLLNSLLLAAQQPNVIFIYADDWGYGDLSLHGHSTITTPNLDQLAQEGTEFLQFNVCNPVCSPSRVAIMTGHYPARHFVHQHFANHDLNMSRGMPDWLDPEAPMLSRLFQEAGYYTVQFDASNFASGTYFYSITTDDEQNNFVMTKRMILVK